MTGVRVHWWPPRKLRRDLDHRFADQHRHRIQVAGVALQLQPLRFKRQRPAASEWVVKGGQLLAIEQLLRARMVGVFGTGAPPALPDLVARRLQHRLVSRVLPQYELPDDLEQPLPLDVSRAPFQRGLRPGIRTRLVALTKSLVLISLTFEPSLLAYAKLRLGRPLRSGIAQ